MRTAIIIGGGIGGLTTAIALRRVGIEATVYERAPELGEVGAGLTLWANAVKALRKLGLAQAVQAAGAPGLGGSIRTWRGDVLSAMSGADLEGRYGAANVAIHRATLQTVLLDALGRDHVRLDMTLAGLSQDETSVTARFEGGQLTKGDMLIGADGIHSVVRRELFGPHALRYAGYTAWRGVAEMPAAFFKPDLGFEAWGRGQRFGLVPIGGRRVYWFATHNAPQGQGDAPQGRKAELLDLFQGWLPPVEDVIKATDAAAILRNDIVDREPLQRWTDGRVTLLGDAAHPMTPNLGQGACQAIEDAVMLANRLKERDDVNAALLSYEMHRIQRANFIVHQSWRIGSVAQWGNPVAASLRDTLMKLIGSRLQGPQLKFLLGYEP